MSTKTKTFEESLEGWEKSWEIVNNQLPNGVNPSAYRLGYLEAASLASEKIKRAIELARTNNTCCNSKVQGGLSSPDCNTGTF